MREILFRGKRLDNSEWVEGSFVTANGQINAGRCYILPDIADFSYGDNGNRVRIGCFAEVDPATVGQFTGMTDKNGRRIFEGDIIKIEHDDYAFDGMSLEYRTEQGMVAYDEVGTIGIVVERYKGANVWSDFFHILGLTDRIANWTFEILGNVHDNPELLEGGAEGE